jgi:hypothetical protein
MRSVRGYLQGEMALHWLAVDQITRIDASLTGRKAWKLRQNNILSRLRCYQGEAKVQSARAAPVRPRLL